MIVFSCGQCGKRFERPESAAGTLIWCGCGARNVVPWESTLAEAAPPVLPAMPVPVPEVEPIPWALPAPSYSPEGSRGPRRRDPACCFNHQATPAGLTCANCGEKFCPDCVVTMNGQTRCGPCKNFLLRGMQRPAQVSVAALMATIVTLLGGPGLILLLFMAAGVAAMRQDIQAARQAAGAIGCFGLLMQLTALVLAIAALRRVETNPRVGGRGLALTGLVGVLVFGVMIGEVAWLIWHSM